MGKGFKQGEPLSLYLFNLVSEALVSMFRNTDFKGFLAAVEVGKNKVKIKHLLFADNTPIFDLGMRVFLETTYVSKMCLV